MLDEEICEGRDSLEIRMLEWQEKEKEQLHTMLMYRFLING